MKAFLSHSGHDKEIVHKVFEILGPGQAIYDSDAFRSGLSTAEWMDHLLPTADLFVLFWSHNAANAEGVKYEIEAARIEIAQRSMGVFIVSIDGEPYSSLPHWLQQHYVEQIDSPAIISRRILARLAHHRRGVNSPRVFVNRRDELAEAERLLAAPADEVPSCLAICGWDGIGRRSFAVKVLKDVYPSSSEPHPTVSLSDAEGTVELFRKLVDLTDRPSVAKWASLSASFEALSLEDKCQELADRIECFRSAGEHVFVIDDGGVVADNNKYHRWVSALLHKLRPGVRPALILIQQRLTSASNQRNHPNTAFIRLSSLEDDHAQTLLGLVLRNLGVKYARNDLEDLCSHIGGHPADLVRAADFAQRRGLVALVNDKTAFRQATTKHSIDLLSRMDLTESDFLVVSIVRDYRLMPIDDLLDLLSEEQVVEVVRAPTTQWLLTIERLEQFSILERWAGYLRVAPFLVDAVARFVASRPKPLRDLLARTRKPYSRAMLDLARRRSLQGGISLASIEGGLLASLRENDEAQWIRQLVLPSHLLYLARECYDRRSFSKAARLVREALQRSNHMTGDARAEANRLLAMAVIRMGRYQEADAPLQALQSIGSNTARRNAHFIRGFRARINGNLDIAEEQFRLSLGFGPRNFHTLRELAHVLLVQRRYDDAERFARSAYGVAPTNPFVIDILCAVLIGKPRSTVSIQADPELAGLLEELRLQDELQGTDFYSTRLSHFFSTIGEARRAMELASSAVRSRNYPSFAAILGLAERAIESGQYDLARKTLQDAKRRAQDANRHDRSHWPRILDLEIQLLLASGDVNGGMRTLRDSGQSLPLALRRRLLESAASVLENPSTGHSDPSLTKWLSSQMERSDRRPGPFRDRSPRTARDRSQASNRAMPDEVAQLRHGEVIQGKVIDHSDRFGVFVDVEGFKALVPRKFVDRQLSESKRGSEFSFTVEALDPVRPSLILRPTRS